MSMIRVERFGGMVPLQDNRLLADYHAAYAQNVYLQSGTLRPVAALVPIYTVSDVNVVRSVYRIPKVNNSIDSMADSYWLEFPVENTWVVRNPTSQLDDHGRYYWADGLNPPGYTTGDRIVAGQPKLVIGIPAPETAPGVTNTGGTTPVTTRAYVYTWISASGEEGPPSPPTVLSANMSGTWHITMTAPLPADTANRTLTTTRIYRTITSDQGVATFFHVVDLPIATLTYDDTIADGVVSLNDELASTNWLAPPADLNGLVAMPNGMIAGFRQHGEIWFCEPYRPHAWPPQYMIAIEGPIVGLGVQQQTLVIMTSGWTYMATGISPDAMALTKVSNLEPCTSMGSIVSSPDGVLYTSVNGLIMVAAGVENNVTANLVRKDEWPTLLYLPNLHAISVNRSYLAFSSPNDASPFQANAFQIPTAVGDPLGAFQTRDYSGTRDGALISLMDERAAFMPLHTTTPVSNILQDIWTGEPMILQGGVVYHLDVRLGAPRVSDYLWRSKVFQTQYKQNWGAAKIFYGPPAGVTGTPDAPTYFRFYADGRMIHQRVLPPSGQQFRLPSGYKSDFIQFELEGQLEIFNVQIATSARELRNA